MNKKKRKKRLLEPLDEHLISTSLKAEGLSLEAKVLPIMLNWADFIGPAAPATQAYAFKRQTQKLIIKVKNSSWNQQLSLLRISLLKRINNQIAVYESEFLHRKRPKLSLEDIAAQLKEKYAKNPIIKQLDFITGRLQNIEKLDDAALNQQLEKRELLQEYFPKAFVPPSQEKLEAIQKISRSISDSKLRTSFTELMLVAETNSSLDNDSHLS